MVTVGSGLLEAARSFTPPSHSTCDAVDAIAVGIWAGKNFTEIAEIVGYTNRGTAYEAVMRAIKRETLENVEEIRAGELSRIDAMLEASWPIAIATIETVDDEGNPLNPTIVAARMDHQLKAQATVLKLMERRAKYVGGLESPAQVDIKAEVTTPDQFAAYLLGAREAYEAQRADAGGVS
jgi:hypothetical protein